MVLARPVIDPNNPLDPDFNPEAGTETTFKPSASSGEAEVARALALQRLIDILQEWTDNGVVSVEDAWGSGGIYSSISRELNAAFDPARLEAVGGDVTKRVQDLTAKWTGTDGLLQQRLRASARSVQEGQQDATLGLIEKDSADRRSRLRRVSTMRTHFDRAWNQIIVNPWQFVQGEFAGSEADSIIKQLNAQKEDAWAQIENQYVELVNGLSSQGLLGSTIDDILIQAEFSLPGAYLQSSFDQWIPPGVSRSLDEVPRSMAEAAVLHLANQQIQQQAVQSFNALFGPALNNLKTAMSDPRVDQSRRELIRAILPSIENVFPKVETRIANNPTADPFQLSAQFLQSAFVSGLSQAAGQGIIPPTAFSGDFLTLANQVLTYETPEQKATKAQAEAGQLADLEKAGRETVARDIFRKSLGELETRFQTNQAFLSPEQQKQTQAAFDTLRSQETTITDQASAQSPEGVRSFIEQQVQQAVPTGVNVQGFDLFDLGQDVPEVFPALQESFGTLQKSLQEGGGGITDLSGQLALNRAAEATGGQAGLAPPGQAERRGAEQDILSFASQQLRMFIEDPTTAGFDVNSPQVLERSLATGETQEDAFSELLRQHALAKAQGEFGLLPQGTPPPRPGPTPRPSQPPQRRPRRVG